MVEQSKAVSAYRSRQPDETEWSYERDKFIGRMSNDDISLLISKFYPMCRPSRWVH